MLHRYISYAAAGLIVAHVAILWLADTTVWTYVSLDAPWYMLAGLAAVGLIATMIIIALPTRRRWWHPSHRTFQQWHYYISLAAIGATLWHIVGSGFYFSTLEAWLISILVVGLTIAHRFNAIAQPDMTAMRLAGLALFPVAFVLVKQL